MNRIVLPTGNNRNKIESLVEQLDEQIDNVQMEIANVQMELGSSLNSEGEGSKLVAYYAHTGGPLEREYPFLSAPYITFGINEFYSSNAINRYSDSNYLRFFDGKNIDTTEIASHPYYSEFSGQRVNDIRAQRYAGLYLPPISEEQNEKLKGLYEAEDISGNISEFDNRLDDLEVYLVEFSCRTYYGGMRGENVAEVIKNYRNLFMGIAQFNPSTGKAVKNLTPLSFGGYGYDLMGTHDQMTLDKSVITTQSGIEASARSYALLAPSLMETPTLYVAQRTPNAPKPPDITIGHSVVMFKVIKTLKMGDCVANTILI
ncbi:hypothetical protein EXA21_04660 [Vibrio cincinnatiensis]|uniref:hypothetical protein n=1 Tax=Vibrio cincinnatiensis TaxID=675 RepID=UPI001EE1473D|nr:hypothetical protein [Vibrio cincinnatiensis]MCG3758847.1 hypothetical protein [Vibrio cincinnatiensis]MCG3762197.1 hypothetical protein [Vibrio cincinnatiensis]